MKARFLLFSLTFVLFCCKLVEEDIQPEMLDSERFTHPAVTDTSYFLISDSLKNPADSIKNIPVIITVHGFTATPFEWQEFREFSDSLNSLATTANQMVLVSQVLLGGHGLSYDDFKEASWKDWQKPILDEYKALSDLGYTNISLAGSSTGGALILDHLANNAFSPFTKPKHIFLIDAIVLPSAKVLTLADLAGWFIGNNIARGDTETEIENWYTNRPQEALNQLLKIISRVRKQLQKGITLPAQTDMTIFKSKKDGSADPVSALLIYKGVKTSEGKRAHLKIIDSNKHVFTRLRGRSGFSESDRKNQIRAFEEMREAVRE